MIAGVYDIKITGLGFFPKTGVISIRCVDQQLSGSITMNKKEVPFNYGTFLGENVELVGDIPLAIGSLAYVGKGTIVNGVMNMSFETEKGRLVVTGKKRGMPESTETKK